MSIHVSWRRAAPLHVAPMEKASLSLHVASSALLYALNCLRCLSEQHMCLGIAAGGTRDNGVAVLSSSCSRLPSELQAGPGAPCDVEPVSWLKDAGAG